MRIEVLGPIRAESEGMEITLGGPQQRLVFALLIVAAGRVVTTEQLIDGIWRSELPNNARKTIQVHVSKLRKALGADVIRSTAGGYRLAPEVETDVAEFEELVEEGSSYLPDRPQRAGDVLRRALRLWRGTPFAQLSHEEALLAEIRRLEDLRLAAVEDRLDADIAVGHAAVGELEALIEEYPLRERLRALHMTALYRSGRQSEALASYRAFRDSLVEGSGLEPSPALQDLELRILQQDPSLGPALPAPAPPVAPGLPPARYSSLVGREAEIEHVGGLLEDHRLLTLLGPGGIGKSSLAAAVLEAAAVVPDGAPAWVEVETTAPGDLAAAVARAMGLHPPPGSDPEELIIGCGRERRYLLAFDGCEPLVGEVAGLADRLLGACPDLHVLATSREALGLAGERVVRVEALDPDQAYRLFCDRAGLDREALDESAAGEVGRVCEALDGIPLAIELAAARLRTLPLPHLIRRLHDLIGLLSRSRLAGDRHQSLAAALETSYGLLDPAQQKAFRMLSVFRQRFEIDAVSAFAAGGLETADRLIEVSLVQPPDADGVCRMLEPIRQFAASLLEEAGEANEARDRQARWMVTRCGEIAEAQLTERLMEARRWVAANRLEVMAALDRSLEADQPGLGISILASVGRQLANLGYPIPAAVPLVTHHGAGATRELAVAMAHTVLQLHLTGRYDEVEALLARAEALAVELDDRAALGAVLARKAVFSFQFEGEGGLGLLLQAVAMLEDAGTIHPHDYTNLGILAVAQGEIDLAETYASRGLRWEEAHLGRTTGDFETVLSSVRFVQGDLDDAIRLARIGALGRTEQQSFLHARQNWTALAWYLILADRLEDAAEALRRADELQAIIGGERFSDPGSAMRLAIAAGDADAAVSRAEEWFSEVVSAESPLDPRTPDLEYLLNGDPGETSPFLDVLLPLTQALLERGETDPACRFVHAAPALMEEAAFEGWEGIGEARRWRELGARCAGREISGPVPSTLEEAFDLAAGYFGFRRPE